MINYYYSPSYLDPTLAQMISSVKDGVQLLITQTDTEIYQVVADTVGEEYEVILNAGNGVYFDIHIASGLMSVSFGKVSEGVYTAVYTSSTYDSHTLTHTNNPFYCELAVINGGDMWEFRVICSVVGFTYPTQYNIRSTLLESSLSSDVMRIAGTYYNSGSGTFNSFPYNDWAYMESGYVMLDASGVSSTIAERNTPDGKVILFPALLGPRVGNSLGVPTIGSKIAYSMLGRGMPISTYTEFVVGGSRFVSLGSVAIRSS